MNWGPQICGGARYDYNFLFIQGKVSHNANQLTIEFASSFMSGTNNFSLGFRDLSLLFQTISSTPATSVCDFGSYSASSPSCLCQKGQFNVAGSGNCTSCNSACSTCFGTSASDCTSCKSGYSFNGQTCTKCHSTCDQCNGTTQTDCTKCNTGEFLYWNGTCQPSCDPPLVIRTVGDIQFCDPQPASPSNATNTVNTTNTTTTPTNNNNSSNNSSYSNSTDTNSNNTPNITVSNTSNSSSNISRSEYIGAAMDTIAQGATLVGGVLRTSNQHSGFMISLVKLVKYVKFVEAPIHKDIRDILDSNSSGIFSVSTAFTFSMPKSFKDGFQNHQLPSPFENQINHSSYLVNHWDTMSNYFILFILGVLCRIVEKLSQKTANKILMLVTKRLRIITQWNFLLCIIFNTYDDLTLFAILEFQTVTFDSTASIISFIICLIVTFGAIYLLTKVILISRQAIKVKGQKFDAHFTDPEKLFYHKWENYQVLYSGFKNKSLTSQAYLFWFTCRVVVTYLIVGVLYKCPIVQVIHFMALSILMLVYLLKTRPLNDIFSLLVSIIFEVMILVVNICLSALTFLDAAESLTTDVQYGLSRVILFANTSIDTFGNIVMWLYVLLAVRTAYKTSKVFGLSGKTNWITVFIAPYQNPGEDFHELSNHETLGCDPIEKKRINNQYQTSKRSRIHAQGLVHSLRLNIQDSADAVVEGKKLTNQDSRDLTQKIKSINFVKNGFRHNKTLSKVYPISPTDNDLKNQLDASPEAVSTTRIFLKSPNNSIIKLLEPADNSRQIDLSIPHSCSSDTRRQLFLNNNNQIYGEKQYRARILRHNSRQPSLDSSSQSNLPITSNGQGQNIFNCNKWINSTDSITKSYEEASNIHKKPIKSLQKEDIGSSDISIILGPQDISFSESRRNRFLSQDEAWIKETANRNELPRTGATQNKRSSFQRLASVAGFSLLESNSKILSQNSLMQTQQEKEKADNEYGSKQINETEKGIHSGRRSLINKLFFRKKAPKL